MRRRIHASIAYREGLDLDLDLVLGLVHIGLVHMRERCGEI